MGREDTVTAVEIPVPAVVGPAVCVAGTEEAGHRLCGSRRDPMLTQEPLQGAPRGRQHFGLGSSSKENGVRHQ